MGSNMTATLTDKLQSWARCRCLVETTIAELRELDLCPWLYTDARRLGWAEAIHTAGKLTPSHAGAQLREIAATLVNSGANWHEHTDRECRQLLRRLQAIRLPVVRF